MARWRLKDKHYLAVEGVDYEYKETGATGKQKKVVHPVPQYLDPNDPADYTHPELFAIIVSNGEGADPRDLIFTGPPTPEMEPLDAGAEALSAAASSAWVHPIETLSGQVYGDKLIRVLEDIANTRATSAPAGGGGSNRETELEAQNAQLAAQLAELQARAEAPVRRV